MKHTRIGLTLAIVLGLARVLHAGPDAGPARVTIAEFEQFLASGQDGHDADFAKRLAGFELTERASSARVAEWQKRFNGKRTREVLTALADLSAFEELPAAELPADPPPDLATQRAMFSRVLDYVATTLPRLPNFAAQRNTTRFELATSAEVGVEKQTTLLFRLPHEKLDYQALGRIHAGPGGGEWLYLVATSSKQVTFRDGREISEAGDAQPRVNAHSELSTVGEFGPILGVIVGDAVYGKVEWDHWERDGDKTLAVFRYSVPERASHYKLETSPLESASFPAYKGEIAVDPASGTIYRLVLLADENDAKISETGIVVEYGPVEIGGKTYTCPIRSIAISRGPVRRKDGSMSIPEDMARTELNDVSFTEYHVFRAEMRILPDAGTP
jgi:hypothetical protein